jgi:hypothetical protein
MTEIRNCISFFPFFSITTTATTINIIRSIYQQKQIKTVPGSTVYVKARHVMQIQEVSRQYGTNWATQLLTDCVVDIERHTKTPGKGHINTYNVAN